LTFLPLVRDEEVAGSSPVTPDHNTDDPRPVEVESDGAVALDDGASRVVPLSHSGVRFRERNGSGRTPEGAVRSG
jgi:hypothetical protein